VKPIFDSRLSRWLILTLVITFTLLFGIGTYLEIYPFKILDHFFYDRFMQASGSQKISKRIIIVDIDETSLSGLGQWPWSRYRVAQLVKTINDLNPKAIGFDIVLPEPDRTSLKNIQGQFKKDFELKLGFTGVPGALTDNDAYLAYIFKQSLLTLPIFSNKARLSEPGISTLIISIMTPPVFTTRLTFLIHPES